MIPAVRATTEVSQREAVALQWGLVPRWSKDAKSGANSLTPARKDRIEAGVSRRLRAPMCRASERFTRANDRVSSSRFFKCATKSLRVAALWERWRAKMASSADLRFDHDRPERVVTPLTTACGDPPRPAIDRWLDRPPTRRRSSSRSSLSARELMKATPVSVKVNSVRNEGRADRARHAITTIESPPQLSLGFE